MDNRNRFFKKSLWTILKLSMAFALVAWMVNTGKLDFSELSIYINNPLVFLANIMVWLIGPTFLGAYRWILLLSGLHIQLLFKRAYQLTLIGFFFNSAMPGAVGGDVIKAVYLVKEMHSERKTPALLAILMDRLTGLFGLFTIGTVGVLVNWNTIAAEPSLKTLGISICSVFFTLLFLVVLVFASGHKIERFLQKLNFPAKVLVMKIISTLLRYRSNPRNLLGAWVVSIVIQMLFISYIMFVTKVVSGVSMSLATASTILPIGIVTTALPLAPGGMGVGHVAFEHLFTLAGIKGGANIFNIFFLGQICLNMLGVFPYLFAKPLEKAPKASLNNS